MLATTILIAVALGLLIGRVVLFALFLKLGLKWAKVVDAPARRLVAASAVVVLAEIAWNTSFSFLSPSTTGQAVLWNLAALAISIAISCFIISRFFSIGPARSLQAWLPTMLSSIIGLLVAVFVVRPYLFESFVIPTNAMAPTLLGDHWQSTCPDCGQRNYGLPVGRFLGGAEPPGMICENFHTHHVTPADPTTYPADRFLVARFIAPRRWDVVVFHYPEDPAILHVKRLVGMPGETIHIEDGAVWADGVRLEVPDVLKGIQYESNLPDRPEQKLWGTTERPAKLSSDEYFVLGDFSANAVDSRLWLQGAPGHHAFAVPRSYLRGVVTHVFWPLDRLRVVR